MIELNDALVNPNNICSAKRYYEISTRTGAYRFGVQTGSTEAKPKPHICINFIGDGSETIYFDSAEDLNIAYLTLKTYNGNH